MASQPIEPYELPPTCIVSGLGAELEERLLGPLEEAGVVEVVERCLSADHLRSAALSGRAEAAIVSTDLHGISAAALEQLRLPRVVLVMGGDIARWHGQPGVQALAYGAGPEQVRDALVRAMRREPAATSRRSSPTTAAVAAVPTHSATPRQPDRGRLVVVTKFRGAPGATTVATSLAALLDQRNGAVLCDLDPAAAATAHTDADPTRNVYLVAYAAPESAEAWARALDAELQALAKGCGAALLAGVPKPEQRGVLAPGLVRRLMDELRARFGWVVVDLGLDSLLGPSHEVELARVVLDEADAILLVGSGDLVGLHHSRQALRLLQPFRSQMRLVLNRHDARRHYSVAQIAYALGDEPIVTIPYDYKACARAIESQQPVAFDQRGRAARALRELARQLVEPEPVPASKPVRRTPVGWLRRASRLPKARKDASLQWSAQ